MGRLGRIAIILLAALLLAGCTGTPSATQLVSGAPGTVGSSFAIPAGLYGLDSAITSVSADGALIQFPADCEKLIKVLDAGSWTSEVLVEPLGALSMYLVALQRAGHSGLVTLHPGVDTCHGTLTVSHSEKLELTGVESFKGTASFLAFGCQQTDIDAHQAGITGFYDATDGVHLALSLNLSTTIGKQNLDDVGDLEVSVAHGDQSMLATMGGLLAASLSGADEEDSVPTGAGYIPGDDFTGSIAVTSLTPLTGTINLTGLIDNETGAPLNVVAGFRCTL